MENKTIEELIKDRIEWVESSRKNKFDFDSVLAGIYHDPSHFVFEILQNAEDAGAQEISFNLFEDRLEITHDGRDFTFEDVDGVTGIGISTKADDLNKIGKFGVGFKSVFAVTSTPIIHSGSYHFSINDFVIPSLLDHNGVDGTQFIFRFNHKIRTPEQIFSLIDTKLRELDLTTILFLEKIEKINWRGGSRHGTIYKETTENFTSEFSKEVIVHLNGSEKHQDERFLVFSKPITIENAQLKVETAYKLGRTQGRKDKIVEIPDTNLIVFFPTAKNTYLNFLIQGPFKTTPNRENIPLKEDNQNQLILNQLSELVAESISYIKQFGLLNVDFLQVLPTDQEKYDREIYSAIYQKVKEKFLSNEQLLPTHSGKHCTNEEALLARASNLVDLLSDGQLQIPFGRKFWLDTGITINLTPALRTYLMNELDIREVDFEDFARSIDEDFMRFVSDKWLINFYSSLLSQRTLWEKSNHYYQYRGILRRKPILRLSDGSHVAPADGNDNCQVYLPGEEESSFKTIKNSLIQNHDALTFLKELGLKEPDLFTEIYEFILPKYRGDTQKISFVENAYDLKKIQSALIDADTRKKQDLLNEMHDLLMIYIKSNAENKNKLQPAWDVYIPCPELINYFKGYDKVFFVSDLLYKFFPEKELFNEFLMELGCSSEPCRVKIPKSFTFQEAQLLREKITDGSCSYDIEISDFNLEGLDHFLKDMTIERSILLWDLLLNFIGREISESPDILFKGIYRWMYFKVYKILFDSKFLTTLKTSKWLFNQKGEKCLPSELTLDTLHDQYKRTDSRIQYLMGPDLLGFKSDEVRQIEEKYGVVFVPKDEYYEFLNFKEGKLVEEQEEEIDVPSEKDWEPDVPAEDVIITTVNLNPAPLPELDYSGQRDGGTNTREKMENEEDTEKTFERPSPHQLKQIGDWGENYVYKHLKREYGLRPGMEIIWMNENGDIGKGYDFCIKQDGKEIEYIEVKSKVDENPYFFDVSGYQWEFTRALSNKGKGEKFKIFLVSNTGTSRAGIKILADPFGLWSSGRLFAHPVRIRL